MTLETLINMVASIQAKLREKRPHTATNHTAELVALAVDLYERQDNDKRVQD